MVLGATHRTFTLDVCSRITVPVLAVETPASPTPDAVPAHADPAPSGAVGPEHSHRPSLPDAA